MDKPKQKCIWPDFKFPPINLWSVWVRYKNDEKCFKIKTGEYKR